MLEALEARAHVAASRRQTSVHRLHHRLAATAGSVWASPPRRRPRGTWRLRRRGGVGGPVEGGRAMVSIVPVAVWALGSPGARPRRGPARATLAAPVSPWIIPLPACAPGTAALTDTGIAPPTSARRPNRVPRPTAAPAIATDTLADQSCAVSVNSVPWSEVWIDGENTGRHTPLVDLPIDCGQHRLDFKRPDLH